MFGIGERCLSFYSNRRTSVQGFISLSPMVHLIFTISLVSLWNCATNGCLLYIALFSTDKVSKYTVCVCVPTCARDGNRVYVLCMLCYIHSLLFPSVLALILYKTLMWWIKLSRYSYLYTWQNVLCKVTNIHPSETGFQHTELISM